MRYVWAKRTLVVFMMNLSGIVSSVLQCGISRRSLLKTQCSSAAAGLYTALCSARRSTYKWLNSAEEHARRFTPNEKDSIYISIVRRIQFSSAFNPVYIRRSAR